MNNKKMLTFFSSLIVLAVLLAACAPAATAPPPEIIIETVVVTEVVTEVVVEEVVVTQEVEVLVPVDLVTIVARCRAKPPTEDWRCNNLLHVVADVNADLEAAGDPRRVDLKTIQDNTDFGDIMQEFALSYSDGQAPDILLTGHEFIGTEATAGRIIALDDMLGDYAEFDNVIDALWNSVQGPALGCAPGYRSPASLLGQDTAGAGPGLG